MNTASKSGSRRLDGDEVMKTWRTYANPDSGEPWEFFVNLRESGEEVKFRGATFNIAEGEVFVLTENLELTQIDEEAGRVDDSANLGRLSELLTKHKSEQDAATNPRPAVELKSQGS